MSKNDNPRPLLVTLIAVIYLLMALVFMAAAALSLGGIELEIDMSEELLSLFGGSSLILGLFLLGVGFGLGGVQQGIGGGLHQRVKLGAAENFRGLGPALGTLGGGGGGLVIGHEPQGIIISVKIALQRAQFGNVFFHMV